MAARRVGAEWLVAEWWVLVVLVQLEVLVVALVGPACFHVLRVLLLLLKSFFFGAEACNCSWPLLYLPACIGLGLPGRHRTVPILTRQVIHVACGRALILMALVHVHPIAQYSKECRACPQLTAD